MPLSISPGCSWLKWRSRVLGWGWALSHYFSLSDSNSSKDTFKTPSAALGAQVLSFPTCFCSYLCTVWTVQPQVWESVLPRFCLAFPGILSAVRMKENTLAQKCPCSAPVLSVKNEDVPQLFGSQKKVKWCFWGLLVLIEMPTFSLGRQGFLWLLSFPALSFFPCAITKNTQVWIPLLPPSFNSLAEPGANLHCIWFYMETRAVSRSNGSIACVQVCLGCPILLPWL